MIEHVICNNILLALIVRAHFKKDGIEFFTPGEFSQQLGYMNRPKGYTIEPHIHKRVERKVWYTQEVLLIKSGRVRVDFYDQAQDYFESRIISEGDVMLLAAGGHGFEMLEDSEIIEIKQGPYSDINDKVVITNNISKQVIEP